jgi:3-hydroxyisobutyrate dehydrogenase-like beta-hydroxyacid dehydrogenase
MSDVTVVGLGAMGSALVKALVAADHTVTVWNRTRSKADALGGLGVDRAPSAADAIAASPITIVSVSTYEATRNILESTAEACSDRALVQLTTGTTAEAAKLAAWAQQHGASYVDGVIMAYPSDIGGPQTTLVVAGLEDTWDRCAQVLRALGGGTIWVGEDVRRPATLDAAWFAPLIGMAIGVVHGALLCEKAGLPVESYAEMLPSVLEVAANQGPHLGPDDRRQRVRPAGCRPGHLRRRRDHDGRRCNGERDQQRVPGIRCSTPRACREPGLR